MSSRSVSTGMLTDNPASRSVWERPAGADAIDNTTCDEAIPFSVAMITGWLVLALAASAKTTTTACDV